MLDPVTAVLSALAFTHPAGMCICILYYDKTSLAVSKREAWVNDSADRTPVTGYITALFFEHRLHINSSTSTQVRVGTPYHNRLDI